MHLVGNVACCRSRLGCCHFYAAAVRQPYRFTRVTALSVPPFAALNDTSIVRPSKWQSKYILWFQFAGLSEASLKRRDYSAIDSLWSQ